MPRFLTDENIPAQVVRVLRNAGYDVVTVTETGRSGIRNNELAELSSSLDRIILTRDVDFTRLSPSLMQRTRVIHLLATGPPEELAALVSEHVVSCVKQIDHRKIVVLDWDGCHSP